MCLDGCHTSNQNRVLSNVDSSICNSKRGIVSQRLCSTVKLDSSYKIGEVYFFKNMRYATCLWF